MEGYRLQVKFGDAEFNAEGPEERVREDYDRFLGKLPATAQTPARKNGDDGKMAQDVEAAPVQTGEGVDQALLEKVFQRHEDFVSLRLLPPAESANRQADAAILLIYGFKVLLNQEEVAITRLTKGLRRSGISFERMDRFMGVHSQFLLKGGARNAARYRLNNVGVTQAEALLRTWFK